MRRILFFPTALILWVSATLPVASQNGLAGAYLAARHAGFAGDYQAAATYYTQALARDPSNLALMDRATLSFVGTGQVDRAIPIARRMQQAGVDNQTASLVIMADLIKRGAFDEVQELIDGGLSVGRLADALLLAWSEYGMGRMSQALQAFDTAAAEQGMGLFGNYHKALALASVGDFDGAAQLFSSEQGDGMRYTRRGALANISILSQLERNDEAIELITRLFGNELDPGLAGLQTRLEAGESLPFTTITSAADGAAEVFFTVAEAVNGEANDTYTLMFARIAEYLQPGHVDSVLLVAELLEKQQQYELATQAYRKVPADDPAYYAAELGRANTLEQSGKTDAAVEVLAQLAKSHSSLPLVHINLGDTLAALRRYDEAAAAYSEAISLFAQTAPAQWYVYYARGIAYERQGLWDNAEADFRFALELSPDQPRVLNYLGYSFVEMRIHLDEALDMIERAVAGRPNDGYITDSLGWVLYRLGRYEEAVPHMERAAELMPVDPIINDHLGDVLWAVGRKLEAEFQWKRALSFVDPEDIPAELSPDRIRRKLEVGLDAVLQEEGAEPLKVANGD